MARKTASMKSLGVPDRAHVSEILLEVALRRIESQEALARAPSKAFAQAGLTC